MKIKTYSISRIFWIAAFGIFFYFNLMPLYLLFLFVPAGLGSSDPNPLMFFGIVIMSLAYGPYFLALGIIDLVTLLGFIITQRPRGIVKIISFAAFIFPAIYFLLSAVVNSIER